MLFCQGVKRLFVLAFDNTDNGNKKVERDCHGKYSLPRVNITNYNVLIDDRNFYDQPLGDQIKKYGKIRKKATGQDDVYTTEYLLDYQYVKDHYQLTAVDLSKQKELDANPRTIQKRWALWNLDSNSQVCKILKKTKDTVLEFYKGTAKVL